MIQHTLNCESDSATQQASNLLSTRAARMGASQSLLNFQRPFIQPGQEPLQLQEGRFLPIQRSNGYVECAPMMSAALNSQMGLVGRMQLQLPAPFALQAMTPVAPGLGMTGMTGIAPSMQMATLNRNGNPQMAMAPQFPQFCALNLNTMSPQCLCPECTFPAMGKIAYQANAIQQPAVNRAISQDPSSSQQIAHNNQIQYQKLMLQEQTNISKSRSVLNRPNKRPEPDPTNSDSIKTEKSVYKPTPSYDPIPLVAAFTSPALRDTRSKTPSILRNSNGSENREEMKVNNADAPERAGKESPEYQTETFKLSRGRGSAILQRNPGPSVSPIPLHPANRTFTTQTPTSQPPTDAGAGAGSVYSAGTGGTGPWKLQTAAAGGTGTFTDSGSAHTNQTSQSHSQHTATAESLAAESAHLQLQAASECECDVCSSRFRIGMGVLDVNMPPFGNGNSLVRLKRNPRDMPASYV